ncbi:MFS transporter [Frankia sp. R43]|uniref:MFS transporter n=1 Tax=Frankia sp. R43 TaxID=269536 RepID=UPI0009FB6D81|nr:MFS transporter [Frankia sp. R43]
MTDTTATPTPVAVPAQARAQAQTGRGSAEPGRQAPDDLPATTQPPQPPLPAAAGSDRLTARQRVALLLLLGTQFMLAVDFSILNVALPSIGAGVGISEGHLQWIATAFALPSAGFTLLFARIADLTGRLRLFMVGLGLLIVASLVGGVASTPAVLLAARVGQGMAAAIATPAALSLLVTTFPEGPARQRALGLNGALLPAGFTIGALIGGLLTQYLSWRWAFLLNVPIALAILAAAPRVVTDGRGETGGRLDVPGALTVTGGLVALIYGISTGGEDGWGRPVVWITAGVGLALLVAFWRIESTSSHPLASLAVLRRRAVGGGNAGGFVIFAMGSAIVFLLTVYLQELLGYSAMVTGLIFGVPGAAAFTAGIVAPRVLRRISPRTTLVTALFVQGSSAVALAFVDLDRTSLTLVMIASVLGFFGHALGIVGFLVTATADLPDDEQGLATGLATMTQQIGLTVGIPILSAVVAANAAGAPGTLAADEATLDGIRMALSIDGAVTIAAGFAVAAILPRLRTRTARTATDAARRTTG